MADIRRLERTLGETVTWNKARRNFLAKFIVTKRERLEKLLALLTVAFCWADIIGQWLARTNPIKIKKHGRLAKSLFRQGFDYLRPANFRRPFRTKTFSVASDNFSFVPQTLNRIKL